MTKHLLAGAAAIALISGAASAQTYPPAPPPPPGVAITPAPPPPAPPPGLPMAAPKPEGDHGEVTVHKEVDENGNTVIEKDIHREGLSGSTETHIKKEKKED